MPLPPSDVKAVAASRDRASAGHRVFIDFDNTITCGDVLDGIIEQFATNDSWRTLEEAWVAGRIGARACLDGQMRVLRARLLDLRQQEKEQKEAATRKAQVGSGDRSEKIRTYNFPDHRVTDHRVGFTSHQLPAVMEGDLDEIIEALLKAEEDSRDQQ